MQRFAVKSVLYQAFRQWCNDLYLFCWCSRFSDLGMSKRPRKVAFDEEVELAEKRRREEELYEIEEKRECALIRVSYVYNHT